MDFERALAKLQQETKSNGERIGELKKEFATAWKRTQQILRDCGAAGYDRVAVSEAHESVPKSATFPFGARGSIFAFASGKTEDQQPSSGHWPAIWGIVQQNGVWGGCGNSQQAQLNDVPIVDGVYHLQKGTWKKVQ